MKKILWMCLILMSFVFVSTSLHAAGSQSSMVEVKTPTADEEGAFLLDVLGKLKFYSDNGYQVALPQDASFQKWIKAARDGKKIDRDKFIRDFKENVFKADNYAKSQKWLDGHVKDIDRASQAVVRAVKSFGGKTHPRYQVVSTLYGSGQDFDADSGKIYLLTSPEGFPAKSNPAGVIAYEIVRIGLENSLIEKFQLFVWEKNRLAQIICACTLKGVLPYEIDWVLNRPIDSYVTKNNLATLPAILKKYIKDYPRSNS